MSEEKTEARLRVLETEVAVVKNEIKHVRDDISQFSANINKILWIFGGSLIGAIVTWIVRGGLVL